jgi:hypothetical protein
LLVAFETLGATIFVPVAEGPVALADGMDATPVGEVETLNEPAFVPIDGAVEIGGSAGPADLLICDIGPTDGVDNGSIEGVTTTKAESEDAGAAP